MFTCIVQGIGNFLKSRENSEKENYLDLKQVWHIA